MKLKIPSGFAVTVANHGSCPVRGVSVHLIEGNEPQQNSKIKSLLPDETVTVPFVATGNPGEAKVDVERVAGHRRDEQHEQPLHLPRRLPELEGPRHMSADRLLALAAIAIAAVGLGLALWVVVWMRRVRRAQSALLSGGPVADLVEFAVGMQARQELVERRADELTALVERRAAMSASRCSASACSASTPTTAPRACQSTALALLDASGDGVVVSAIQDAGSARVYVKRVQGRRGCGRPAGARGAGRRGRRAAG